MLLHCDIIDQLNTGWAEVGHDIVTMNLGLVDNAKLRRLEALVRPETARVEALKEVERLQRNEASARALTPGGRM